MLFVSHSMAAGAAAAVVLGGLLAAGSAPAASAGEVLPENAGSPHDRPLQQLQQGPAKAVPTPHARRQKLRPLRHVQRRQAVSPPLRRMPHRGGDHAPRSSLSLLEVSVTEASAWSEAALVTTILLSAFCVFVGVFKDDVPRLIGCSEGEKAAEASLEHFVVRHPDSKGGLPVLERKRGNTPYQTEHVPFKQTVRLARSSLNAEDTREEAPASHTIEWTDVTVASDPPARYCICCHPRERSRLLLTGLNGSAEPNRLTAVIGPHGAGKSVLLKFLAGRRQGTKCHEKSTVSINGIAVESKDLEARVGYMREEDWSTMETADTVRESLQFWVIMRMPSQVPAQEKAIIVEDMLESLGLDLLASELVRNLSVADKRRLAIGKKVLGGPEVLLADDIFVGVDSMSAVALASTLKELSKTGVPVLTSMREAKSELYSMIDDVIVLHNGELVYHGAGDLLTDHFDRLDFFRPDHCCPADHVLFLLQKNDPYPNVISLIQNEWVACPQRAALKKAIETRRRSDATAADPQIFPRQSFCSQWRALVSREARRIRNDFSPVCFHLAITIACGYLLGAVFFGVASDAYEKNSDGTCNEKSYDEERCQGLTLARLGVGMIIVLWICVDALLPLVISPEEPRALLYEVTDREYSASAGILAKMCMQALICFFAVGLFWPSLYQLLGWDLSHYGSVVYLSWVLHLFTFTLGLVVACYICDGCTPSESLRICVVIAVLVAFFAGVLITMDEVSESRIGKLYALQYTMPITYGYQLLMRASFADDKQMIDDCEELHSVSDCMGLYPGPYQAERMLKDRDINWDQLVNFVLYHSVFFVEVGVLIFVLRLISQKRR